LESEGKNCAKLVDGKQLWRFIIAERAIRVVVLVVVEVEDLGFQIGDLVWVARFIGQVRGAIVVGRHGGTLPKWQSGWMGLGLCKLCTIVHISVEAERNCRGWHGFARMKGSEQKGERKQSGGGQEVMK